VPEYPEKPQDRKRLLILAVVPRDGDHLLSLWTELECFTEAVDHVVFASPKWGKPYVEHVMTLAKERISHFASNKVTMEARYFLNNRYDVGLWCDAYASLDDNTKQSYDEFGLLNDSVFALRKFSAIFDHLSIHDDNDDNNLQMTSMAYSFSEKWNTGLSPEAYWVESVFRGFNPSGMEIFAQHSCVPEHHDMFCPAEQDNKACIINNFEHDLAAQYPCTAIKGLWPTEPPDPLGTRDLRFLTWIKNTRYWKLLIEHAGFPIAKVNEPDQSGGWYQLRESKVFWPRNPLLKTCTQHIMGDLDTLFAGLDFGKARPFYKQTWDQLSPELQTLAREGLGFDESSWNDGEKYQLKKNKRSNKSNTDNLLAPWQELTQTQQSAWEELECSPLLYTKEVCQQPRIECCAE
jgi:hypothetical protein